MKRTMLACALLLVMLTGLTIGVAEEAPIASLSHMHPETPPEDFSAVAPEVDGIMQRGETIVQSLSEGLMALSSGRVSAFVLFEDTARYIAAQNTQYEVVSDIPLQSTLHMVAMAENAELIARINEALQALQADGSMDRLWQQHVTDILDGQAPQEIAIPASQGAETLRVGVSGDCPPIDYVSASGTPMGYNVALLAAIAEQLDVNLEQLSIESGARFAALGAGTIDLFFWQLGAIRDERMPLEAYEAVLAFQSIDGTVIASDPYGTQGMASLVLKAQ